MWRILDPPKNMNGLIGMNCVTGDESMVGMKYKICRSRAQLDWRGCVLDGFLKLFNRE